MEHLPAYIKIVFILTTVFTFAMLYRAGINKKMMWIMALWLIIQAAISLTGFYKVTTGIPPRFILLLLPPIIFICFVFLSKSGRSAVNKLDAKTLTLIQVMRFLVEVTLYWLFLHKAIPKLMTFESQNFDIICGLTAPLVFYLGYIRKVFNQKILIAWNIICLVLLINIVIRAILSAPFQFQLFGFEQPNVALFYFPFIWLPSFIVPVALFAHLTVLKQLFNKR